MLSLRLLRRTLPMLQELVSLRKTLKPLKTVGSLRPTRLLIVIRLVSTLSTLSQSIILEKD